MSQILDPQPTTTSDPNELKALSTPRPTRGRSVLVWGIISTVLLAGSGAIRSAQSSYYDEAADPMNVEPPFALKRVPRSLDGWRLIEGSEMVLDPLTTRITGSTDHILGNYINEQTGVILSVLMLYGPAEPVLPHTPEVCYPSTGYKAVAASIDRDIPLAGYKTTKFRSNVFAKSGGRNVLQKTVYYSFRHDGSWVPWVNTRNSPRKNPGIFKIQVDRLIANGEVRFQDEPIEDFIAKLVPVLETMIADAKPPAAAGPVAQK